jgi:DNA-binding ferritin-like protein
MEIEIITTTQNDLHSIKSFGILLNKVTSTIKMLHWFVLDHNAHEILGDLYDDLTSNFDKLEEEIIGTCRSNNTQFPNFNIDIFNQMSDMIEPYNDNQTIIDCFYNTSNAFKDILTSSEFNDFLTNVKSGINNTKEDIISNLNKAEYLISMVKI